MREARRWLLGVLGLTVAGCATSRFDRLYDAGMYDQATAVYRADTALHHQEHALYRTGVMYALPGSPVYDAQRALETFDRLLTLFPHTGRRAEVTRLRSVLEEVVRERRDAARARAQVVRLNGRIGDLDRKVDRLGEELDGRQRHLDTLQAANRRLEEALRARLDSLGRLRTELRKLKAIDLQSVQDTSGSGGS